MHLVTMVMTKHNILLAHIVYCLKKCHEMWYAITSTHQLISIIFGTSSCLIFCNTADLQLIVIITTNVFL